MSSPSNILGRLQQLKLWQENHEKKLKTPTSNVIKEAKSVDPGKLRISDMLPNKGKNGFNEIKSLDGKKFDKLLEDKLVHFADQSNDTGNSVPKKAFLKKGTGLTRFKLKPEEYKRLISSRASNQSRPTLHNKRKINHKKTSPETLKPKSKPIILNSNPPLKSVLESLEKENLMEISKKPEFTPLKTPEYSIKTKGRWTSEYNDQNKQISNIYDQQIDKFLTDYCHNPNNNLKNNISQEIDRLSNFSVEPSPNKSPSPAKKRLPFEEGEQTLYEKAIETELLIFEALEKRTQRNSFCSTNTSVLQILNCTPSKVHRVISNDVKLSGPRAHANKMESEHFQSAAEKVNVSEVSQSPKQQIYEPNHWEEPESYDENSCDESKPQFVESKSPVRSPVEYSSDSSADESLTDKITKSPSRALTPRHNFSSTCQDCGSDIRLKIEECQAELESLRLERDRIASIRKQVAKEKRDFEKEMRVKRRRFEEQQANFRAELEEERKQINKEKNIFERANKDTKSTKSLMQQRKKDAEEISNLRQELEETKELLKLRETKNALTVAKLRTHAKQLENKNEELNKLVEKLTKDKARLEAMQKSSQKTSEVKMLHEISKNISKLTEETFRNQKFKAESSSEDEISKRPSVLKTAKLSTKPAPVCSQPSDSLIEPNSDKTESRGKIENFISEDANIEALYAKLFKDSEKSDNAATKTGRSEKLHEDGTKEIKYPNGNVKLISTDGTIRYYHSANDTWHTNYPDGTEIIEFPNGQSEKRFQDGKCIVFFPDGLIQTIHPDGDEEIKYPDGSKVLTTKEGERKLFLTNGQVEIHTKDQKRREYPDGTVKILYPDGSQETRYSNGRIRMKNSNGDVVLDTEGSK